MVIALIVGLKYYRRQKLRTFLLIYVGVGMLVYWLFEIVTVKEALKLRKRSQQEVLNVLFALVEFSVFSYFFSRILRSRLLKLSMFFAGIIFLLVCFLYAIAVFRSDLSSEEILRYSFRINVLEFVFLFLACLLFFYELLNDNSHDKSRLAEHPSFWISSGVFFYSIVSLPYFLIADELFYYNKNVYTILVAVHYVSTSMLFLCLAKAFSCERSLTT